MRAVALFLLPSGATIELCPGDLIGRLASAALRVDNGRVSEAHALVSLRGKHLKLLALRGVLAVEGRRVSEVTLVPGVRVELARGFALEVLDVAVPGEVLAVCLPGLPPQQLLAPVYSVVTTPRPGLLPTFEADAPAHLWSTGEDWRLQVGEAPSQLVVAGLRVEVDGVPVEVVSVPVQSVALSDTRQAGKLHKPIHLVAQFDTVHIHREGEPTVSLGGLSARIISELVAMDGPVDWEVVAQQIWRDEPDRNTLRHKWDVSLSRLRRKLREGGLRPDLVHADGSGKFEILRLEDDVVEDRM
jgi:hypothetical protein